MSHFCTCGAILPLTAGQPPRCDTCGLEASATLAAIRADLAKVDVILGHGFEPFTLDDDEERQPCGCYLDYHSADCPHLTREHDNSEPDDFDFDEAQEQADADARERARQAEDRWEGA